MSIRLPGFMGDPADGNVEGMTRLARAARDRYAATIRDAAAAGEAADGLLAECSQTTDAARAALATIRSRFVETGRSHAQVALALENYARDVSLIAADERVLAIRAQDVYQELRVTIDRLAAIPGSGVMPGTPWNGSPVPALAQSPLAGGIPGIGPPGDTPVPQLLARWAEMADGYRALVSQHGDLTVHRSRVNVRALDALNGVEFLRGFEAYWAAGVPVSAAAVSAWALNGARVSAERLARLDPVSAGLLWASLSEGDRRRLVHDRPDLIGSAAGLPAVDRHGANVAHLREQLRRVSHEVNTASLNRTPASGEVIERLRGLQELHRRYGDGTSVRRIPPEYLVAFDPSPPGAPLAAVSVGNLDTAARAVYLVPGMNSSSLGVAGLVSTARTLQAGVSAAGGSAAVVAWLDYRAPVLGDTMRGHRSVLSDHSARVGAGRLVSALDGYNAARQQSGLTSSLHVVAHSYGTTTASLALASRDLGVDTFTMLGSAGLVPEIRRAGVLRVAKGGVYAMENASDTTADLGRLSPAHPVDPVGDPEFGAIIVGSTGTVCADGTELRAAAGHDLDGSQDNHYLSRGTESWHNVVSIILGREDRITLARRRTGPEPPSP